MAVSLNCRPKPFPSAAAPVSAAPAMAAERLAGKAHAGKAHAVLGYGTRAVHSGVLNFVLASSRARAISSSVTVPAVSP